MSRSVWKQPFIHPSIIEQITSTQNSEIIIQNRATLLTPTREGQRFQVYNGIRCFSFQATQERVGHRLGEFAPTRKRPIPKKPGKK